MNYLHPRSEVRWNKKCFNHRYIVHVPHFLWAGLVQEHGPRPLPGAHWDDYEVERLASMEAHLRPGDVLFDIGAESGWLSAIYAQFVGAENMCLFEPSAPQWPNIQATWQANGLPNPLTTLCGFVSDSGEARPMRRAWPAEAIGSVLLEEMKFRSLIDSPAEYPRVSIDAFVRMTGIVPRAIAMDIEGAELRALQGAREVLKQHRPFVWVSIHEGTPTEPGVLHYDFHSSLQEILDLMAGVGYTAEHLGTDWEQHWFFRGDGK